MDVNNSSIHPYYCPVISKRNWQCNLGLRAGSSVIYPLFTFRLSKQKTLGIQMLLVIQPLKKYLTEHESETLPPCHDKYLASCQDAQRPPSKTASLPEGKCILLLYRILLSTVEQWGLATYNNSPDGQVITPAIAFSTYFAGVVVDRGIKWDTGGTFAGVEYVDGEVIFWPQYTGSPQTVSKNGTNYRWLIFCS